MKKIILPIILSLWLINPFFDLYAQENKLTNQVHKKDSLENLLKNEWNDSIKINILYQITDIYWYESLETSLVYLNRAEIVVLGTKNKNWLIDNLMAKGHLYKQYQHYDIALSFYQKALDEYDNTAIPRKILDIHSAISANYSSANQIEKSLDYEKKGYELALQQKDSIAISNYLNNIGVSLLKLKRPQEALDYFLKDLAIWEIIKDPKQEYHLATLYNNIGMTYNDLQDYEKALLFTKKGYDINLDILQQIQKGLFPKYEKTTFTDVDKEHYLIHIKTAIANSQVNLGIIYLNLEKLEKSLDFLEQGLTSALKLKHDYIIQKTYPNLSTVYERLGNTRKSREVYQEYVAYLNKIDSLKNEQRLESLENPIKTQNTQNISSENTTTNSKASSITVAFVCLSLFLAVLVIGYYHYQAIPQKMEEKNISSHLKESQIQQYKNRIQVYFEQEKPYLNPDFRLKEMADALQMNVNDLSQTIKEGFGQNFYGLVNGYRVQEVKKLLQDDKYSHLTLLAIGLEAGFNSKTTFNTVFKKMTGKTPSQFQKYTLQNTL